MASKPLGVLLAAMALLSTPPMATLALAQGSDPHDAISCVEDLGIKGYGVRINNRCNYPLQLVTCVIHGTQNTCKEPRREFMPVPAGARDHVILDMQVSDGAKYWIVACKDPWIPGNPHMAGGELVADECAW